MSEKKAFHNTVDRMIQSALTDFGRASKEGPRAVGGRASAEIL